MFQIERKSSKQECIPVGCVLSGHLGGGGLHGRCLPRGGVSAWGYLPRGVSVWWVSAQGMSAEGGVCPRRMSAQGVPAWGCLPRHPPGQEADPPGPRGRHPSPLWTNFLTHACENITFPQLLLRAVKISEKHINLWISLSSKYFLSVYLISSLDNSISFHSASNIKKITVFKHVWI